MATMLIATRLQHLSLLVLPPGNGTRPILIAVIPIQQDRRRKTSSLA
jgi:hypothetical protein